MGQNFLFLSICTPAAAGGMGFTWQQGLALVFLSGVIFLVLSLFRVRERFIAIFPETLKNAIGPAIGLFIAFVGLQWGGVIVDHPATLVHMAPPRDLLPLITLASVLVSAALLARNIRWSILAGMMIAGLLGWVTGAHPHLSGGMPLSMETFFALDFHGLFALWDRALIAVLLLFFLDLFDTVGTLVGVSTRAGFMTAEGQLPRAGHAFFADAAATTAGALFGSSTVTTYVESASGVAAGARTGFASVVTAGCFLVAIPIAPYLPLREAAVAPALIVVGICMMAPLARIAWDDITEALPAFFTVAMMAFGFGITEGIAMGCISFAAIHVLAGRARAVHPVLYLVAAALMLRYAFLY
jgi:AGZA family xanthine/uracil permease-like MFS transporter